jgi:ABC-type nitrate/sulfonate/bicarbonate transport system substrate-binding protein
LVVFAIQVLSISAAGAETLRVGKAAQEFSFLPLDVGMRYGIFKKDGIEVENSVYSGGGQLQQALTADSIDIGLGSGPEMWSLVKGVPVKAVAAWRVRR